MTPTTLDNDLTVLMSEARTKQVHFTRPSAGWREPDVIRLAQSLGLDIERTLLLTLKARWEASEGNGSRDDAPDGIASEAVELAFDPNPPGMLAALEAAGVAVPTATDSRKRLCDVVREALLNRMHRMALRSPECERFIARVQAEAAMFDGADVGIRERMVEARGQWILDCSVHSDLLLALVNQQLINARVQQRFMQVYGDLYVELEELTHRADSLRVRIRMKEANPSLTVAELDNEMLDFEAKAQQAMEDLKALAVGVPPISLPGMGTLSAEQVEDYQRQVKDALRRVWRLLHPDRLTQREGYRIISPRQRERLKELWNEIMKVRPAEMAFDPGQLGYGQRSLERILQAEREARAILESIPGLDLAARYQVCGDTPEECIRWYETESRILADDIAQTRAQLKALIDDPDVRERKATLDLPTEQKDEVRNQMRKQTEQLRATAAAMERQLEDLFGNV
jgi:hypothetical protein